MRGVTRVLIVLLLFAALPLRGYAAVATQLCHDQHGGSAAHAAEHDPVAAYGHDSQSGDADHSVAASVCGHCASCCVGASLAPDESAQVVFAPAGTSAIPFQGFAASGRVPGTLDRPPLPL